MKPYFSKSMAAALIVATLTTPAAMAQSPASTSTGPTAQSPTPSQSKPLTPLKVQVVIARYEGDKKVSSFPYMLAVTANHPEPVSLRMGSQVPIPVGQGGIDYKSVGTNIDCSANSTEDGRFQVQLRIEDSSIMERRGGEVPPTLRNFSSSNSVVLRDGQTVQFTAAADKVTGEVVRVDVTMNVEK
jgi:Bacterial type II and III secretion system protein